MLHPRCERPIADGGLASCRTSKSALSVIATYRETHQDGRRRSTTMRFVVGRESSFRASRAIVRQSLGGCPTRHGMSQAPCCLGPST